MNHSQVLLILMPGREMARVIFREGEYLIDTLSKINGGISLISYLILFYISDYYVIRNHHDHVYLERA